MEKTMKAIVPTFMFMFMFVTAISVSIVAYHFASGTAGDNPLFVSIMCGGSVSTFILSILFAPVQSTK